MQKKYVVRRTDRERDELQIVVKKLKGTSEKVRRAQILLKADVAGPNWTDKRIAEAFSCRTRTVEKIRQRLVERGFHAALYRAERVRPPVEKLLDGEQEGAFASEFEQWGGSPHQVDVLRPVVDRNCVAARRGGEQRETNDQSATQVNSIRPGCLASLPS